MKLDLVGEKTLQIVTVCSFLVFLFAPFDFGMRLLFFSMFVYFLVLFLLCTYWANEWYPEGGLKFIIGLLVSIFHTFIFLFSGVVGLALAQLVLKLSPLLVNYLREVFIF